MREEAWRAEHLTVILVARVIERELFGNVRIPLLLLGLQKGVALLLSRKLAQGDIYPHGH